MPSGKRTIIDFNKLYDSNNCGKFRIIEELPTKVFNGTTMRIVKIQFVDTGYVMVAHLPTVLKGAVKDPYAPTVLGVACLGVITGLEYTKNEYDIWYSMIRRCYSPKDPSYVNYGGIGVRVEQRWLCFENFLKDLPFMPGYDLYKSNNQSGIRYEFDKDLLQRNIPKENRVYSRTTCCFIPGQYNNAIKNIENKRYCESTNYIGLYRVPSGNFQCTIMNNGEKNFLGTFTNEIAAANAYNWWAIHYGYPSINNNAPYMPPIEWTRYKSRAKLMCRVVDKK